MSLFTLACQRHAYGEMHAKKPIRHQFIAALPVENLVLHLNNKRMSRGNTILLAALGGAAVAALIANYLSTEQGKQFLNSATNTLKDLSGKATEYAKTNLGEVLNETKNTVGEVVKDKLAQQLSK
jgi:ATP phosphoribosyltransferase regulatory subunit HisZ